MRAFKALGIVINRRNYSESDRIITVFTKNNGKIKIKASGVRKITSRRSSHIELLNLCVFSLYQGKNMPVLTEVESAESFQAVKKDLKKIGLAYHFCELIDGLCPENQEHEDVYHLLENSLRRLSIEDGLESLAYGFELELLKLLGYHQTLNQKSKVDTQAIIEDILERKLKTRQMFPQLS